MPSINHKATSGSENSESSWDVYLILDSDLSYLNDHGKLRGQLFPSNVKVSIVPVIFTETKRAHELERKIYLRAATQVERAYKDKGHGVWLGRRMRTLYHAPHVQVEIAIPREEIHVGWDCLQEPAEALLYYTVRCYGQAMSRKSRLLQLNAPGIWKMVCENLDLLSSNTTRLHAIARLLSVLGNHGLPEEPILDHTPSQNCQLLAFLLEVASKNPGKRFKVEEIL
ncbi:uncharacterized protein F5Z01DRAFT_699084 [Emericellopsis atlantica]|uniref:Uncharacterized protein n=1 Tax=Emericellopsis atlantica TaxID=2614577 RepID=A0A9P7ZC46_9HYPO|nr:uncharacterized protein F5Z01DRAFT_699084 [Emericellopsis atlantica]KAG9249369.1 hypothetical protein F5Z01DRAFT_699084 [Emericellopsis atlantica]